MHHSSLPPPVEASNAHPRAGVRRVNNLPLLIIGGVLAAFTLTVVIVIAGRESDDPVVRTVAQIAPAPVAMAEQIVGTSTGIVAADVVPQAPELPVPPMAVPIATVDGDGPPLPMQPAEVDPDIARLRALRLQQVQKALASRTGVLDGAGARSAGGPAPASRGERSGGYASRRQAQEQEPPGANGALRRFPSPDADGEGDVRPDNNYQQFAADDGADRWRLDSPVEAPRSRFTLRAGYVIPAVLISGVNSDLPGQIIGQVSQDVYDTATGKHKVIPQGTRLVGAYNSQVAYGQRRVLVAWQRIIFPDGRAMDIGSMPGTDATGYAGFADRVDNHYTRIFGQAILLSGVIAGVELSQPDAVSTNGTLGARDALSSALGQSLGTALTQMFRKNLNIAPTLEVRPGFRFNIMVVKDLDFERPYTAMTY